MFRKKSPPIFDAFEKHAEAILAAARLLKRLIDDDDSKLELAAEIKEQEHLADEVTHEVIKQMSLGHFILPFDREDVLALTKALDEVIDSIDNCAEAFAEVYLLSKATLEARTFVDIIVVSAETILNTCKLLRKASRHSSTILQNCIELHRLENEGDITKKQALKALFENLNSDKIAVPYYIAWNDIYHTLEKITDRVEDCANITEQITLKYA